MSEIAIKNQFRESWSFYKFSRDPLHAPSDIQLSQLITSVRNDWNNEKPSVSKATIATVIGNNYIILPADFLSTVRNKKLLSDFALGLDPYIRKQGYTNLSVSTQAKYSGSSYNEFAQNLSKPLRTASLQRLPINIQQRNISGVTYPVWLLYDTAGSVQSYDLWYDARHQIANANAEIKVVTNPSVNDTLVCIHNGIVQTTLTFVASGASTNQINIGVTTGVTVSNIKTALLALGFLGVSILGNMLDVTSPDGQDFTITPDGVKITNTYTSAINTILFDDEGDFLELLKAYVLESLTPHQLLKGISIKDCRSEATAIRTRIINKLRSSTRRYI